MADGAQLETQLRPHTSGWSCSLELSSNCYHCRLLVFLQLALHYVPLSWISGLLHWTRFPRIFARFHSPALISTAPSHCLRVLLVTLLTIPRSYNLASVMVDDILKQKGSGSPVESANRISSKSSGGGMPPPLQPNGVQVRVKGEARPYGLLA
jgi:hypothetical protein